VTRRLTSWTRPLAGLLAVDVGLTLAAPPASAADAGAVTKAPTRSPLAAATAAKLATLAPAPGAFAQAAPAADPAPADNRPFFKTPKGVAALVLMVAGAGYVAYRIPKDNEKVHSPIR
jgi:hypothetical protein